MFFFSGTTRSYSWLLSSLFYFIVLLSRESSICMCLLAYLESKSYNVIPVQHYQHLLVLMPGAQKLFPNLS